MKTLRYRSILTAALLTGSLLLAACSDDPTEMRPERLFRPTNLSGESTLNTIELSWVTVPDAKSYTIEYSTDPSFTEDVKSVTVEGAKTGIYTFTGLEFYTDYYFRITANSAVEGVANSQLSVMTKAVRTKQAPTVLNAITDKGENWITLTWTDEYPVSKIVLTSSTDETFSAEYDISTNETRMLKIENLEPLAYTATIYSAEGIALNSQEANLLAPLMAVADEDIATNSVVLRWKEGFAVTKIELAEEASPSNIQELIIPDATAGSITAENLKALTRYTAKIYVGETPCNTVSFRTWHEIPAGAIEVGASDDLFATIEGAADGAVLLLPAGSSYTYDSDDAFVFTKAITLMSASPASLPTITMNKESKANGDIDHLRFIGVNLVSGGTSYFINVPNTSSETLNLNEFFISDCVVSGFGRSILRSQKTSNQTIGTIVMDNCVVNNAFEASQNYGVFHFQGATGDLMPTSYSITNSTFNGMLSIINHGKLSSGCGSATNVSIANCTFYKLGDGSSTGRYFIDMTANSASDNISINSCIFGQLNNGKSYKGVRAANVSSSNTYYASDFSTSGNSIPSVNTLSETSAQIFSDPENGVFTLINQQLIDAKAGDPRWR